MNLISTRFELRHGINLIKLTASMCLAVFLLLSTQQVALAKVGKNSSASKPDTTTKEIVNDSNVETTKQTQPVEDTATLDTAMTAAAVTSAGSVSDTGEVGNVQAIGNEYKSEVQVLGNTGDLNYRYDFKVPPGRNGLTPELYLSYTLQGGSDSDVFGYGWKLNIPYISIINKTGTDKLYNASSTQYYSSSLVGELSLVAGNVYGAKVEQGDFNKFTLESNGSWLMVDKAGTKYYFGSTTAARQNSTAISSRVAVWMLEEVRDTNGNTIKYTYTKSNGAIYPATILYVNNGTSNKFKVEFIASAATSSRIAYDKSFLSVRDKIITKINIYDGSTLTKSYDLSYVSGINEKRDLLKSITESGYDGLTKTSLPPTTYSYGGSQLPTGWTNSSSTSVFPEAISPYDNGVRFGDIDGDGLTDMIRYMVSEDSDTPSNEYIVRRIHRNNGDGTWATDIPWDWSDIDAPFLYYIEVEPDKYYDMGTRFIDVNGDGRSDLVVALQCEDECWYADAAFDGTPAVYINTGTGFVKDSSWSTPPLVTWNQDHHFLRNEGRDLVDVNGDNLPDVVTAYFSTYTNSSPQANLYSDVYLNTGSSWVLAPGLTFPAAFAPRGAGTPFKRSFEDMGTRVADVNGDGLADVLRGYREDASLSNPNPAKDEKNVYLNTGKGWATSSAWVLPEEFMIPDYPEYTRAFHLVDLNADALPEIVRAATHNGNHSYNFYLNTGNGWVAKSYNLPFFLNEDYRWLNKGKSFVDFDGDTIPDLWDQNYGINNTSVSMGGTVVYNNSEIPDKLTSVNTPYGGTVSIGLKGYFETKAATTTTAGKPVVNPVVVSDVTYNPGIGTSWSENYVYQDGSFYHSTSSVFDKKFAGFGGVTKISGVTKEVTRYHQGDTNNAAHNEELDNYLKIGLPYRTDVTTLNDNIYRRTITKWATSTTATNTGFVYKSSDLMRQYDGDADVKDSALTYEYNLNNGNLASSTSWGVVTGNDNGTFSDTGLDKRVITYTYASNSALNIIGRLATERLDNQSGVKIKESRYYYDTLALNSVNKGNLTKTEQWATSSTYISNQSTYNSFGLKTQDLDPRGNATNYVYDTFNLYPATSTNARSQSTRYAYDYTAGKPRTVIDPNGYTHESIYDSFDRLVEVKEPRGAANSLVTVEKNTYDDTAGALSVQNRKYLDSTYSADMYTYFDGFRRPVQTRSEAETANQFSVRDTVYGTNGNVQKESLPYFSNSKNRTTATNQNNLYTNYSYDALNRKVGINTVLGTTSVAYDQWQEAVTDTLGNTKTNSYDAHGDLVSVVEQNGTSTYTTAYDWTAHKQLAKITDSLGNVRNFSYDGLGRRTSAEDLHASADTTFGKWTYGYDAAGNLATTTDPKGQIIVTTYDVLNRPTAEDYIGQAGIENSYGYDICPNGTGYLCSSTSAGAATSRVYNGAGLVSSESKTIGTTTYTHTYQFDRQNNQTVVTYPDNSDVRYTYNTAGQLEKVEQRESGGSYRDIISNYNYGPHGQIVYQLHGNGASTTRTYDANELYRLRSIVTTAVNPTGGGGEVLRQMEDGLLLAGELTAPEIIEELLMTVEPADASDIDTAIDAAINSDTMPEVATSTETNATSTNLEEVVVVELNPLDAVATETPKFIDTKFRPKNLHEIAPVDTKDSLRFASIAKSAAEKVDIEAIKYMPEVRFKKWGGEVDLGISSLDVMGDAVYSTEKNITQWQDKVSTMLVEAYPLAPTIGMEEGGFEIELVLQERPKQNRFNFAISGADNLDLFYQPALNKEKQTDQSITKCTETECTNIAGEIVVSRPENVVGSYAVYHSGNENKTIDPAVYQTGKVGHIYRPKVIDAVGNEIWGTLTYADGILTVEVPQDFLAKATYPVRVDPTFGYGVIGSTRITGNAANSIRGGTVSGGELGSVESISFYVGGLTANMKALITDSSLNILANGVTNLVNISSSTSAWITMSFSSSSRPVIYGPGTYVLGTITSTTSPVFRYNYDSVGGYSRVFDGTNSYSSPTNPTDATLTSSQRVSIYATYSTPTTTQPLTPSVLWTESVVNPMVVTDTTPEFSAIFNDPTATDLATAYQIELSTTADFSSVYWDSGKDQLSSSTAVGARISDISYGGAALVPLTNYYWRIRLWDNTDTASPWSTSTAYFQLSNTAPTSGYNIYTDGVASGWTLVPHNSTTTVSTSTVYSGTNALKVDFNASAYTDVNFTYYTNFNQSNYQNLDLYFKTDNPDAYYTWVFFVGADTQHYGCCHLGDYVVGGFATGTWNHVVIPFSTFATTTVQLKELVFTTDYNTTIYLDNVRLTGSTVTIPPTFVPVLQNLTYTYDSVGNITRIVDNSGTRTAATTTYTYDNLYRLTSASTTQASSSPFYETYTYNAIGNLVSKSGAGAYTYAGNTGSNYANPHAPTTINGVTYNYDLNGNLASTSAAVSNSWDYRNRLISATKIGTSTTYKYDVNEQRVEKTVLGKTTRYPSTMYETTGASTTKHVYANGVLVSSIDGVGSTTARTYYNHQDHLGSTNIVSTDIGYLDHLYSYLPFGATRIDEGTYNQSNQFIGQNRDQEADLNYLNARYYDGGRGQFLSQDPAFLDIGGPGFIEKYDRTLQMHLMNPQALNSYSYGLNNPITNKDPEGEIVPLLIGAWALAEIGLSAYDIYSTGSTLADPNASLSEKLTTSGLTIAGFALPGGGYGAAGKQAMQIYKQTNPAGQALMKGVNNTDVLKVIKDNYRAGSTVGKSGSTADAVRHEILTGESVGGKFHSIKAQQQINRINNIFKNSGSELSSQERKALNTISNDLKNALKTRK